MGGEVLVAAIVMTALVLIVAQLTRLLKAGMQHRTIREAISRDSASIPELMTALETPPRSFALNDSRIAYVLIALGIALIGAVALAGNVNDLREVGGLSLFPILVGAALLLHKRLNRRPDDVA